MGHDLALVLVRTLVLALVPERELALALVLWWTWEDLLSTPVSVKSNEMVCLLEVILLGFCYLCVITGCVNKRVCY